MNLYDIALLTSIQFRLHHQQTLVFQETYSKGAVQGHKSIHTWYVHETNSYNVQYRSYIYVYIILSVNIHTYIHALHCLALPYIKLHYITLHCIIFTSQHSYITSHHIAATGSTGHVYAHTHTHCFKQTEELILGLFWMAMLSALGLHRLQLDETDRSASP